MTVTVGNVMRSINNYFESGYRSTTYIMTGGSISPDDLLRPGMWIAITGSVFHDGVWQLDEWMGLKGLKPDVPDETFYGRVWFLRPPTGFLQTCEAIAEFAQTAANRAVQSESFGEYSMTTKSGKNGGVLTWQEAFADDLKPYRRMFSEVF